MSDDGKFWLRDIWYYALPGHRLKPGGMVTKQLLGEPVLFCRSRDGAVFALRDICPHRGIPLSHGRFDGAEVECCYHGWRFGGDGTCTAIPSLVEGQGLDLSKIKVRRYPCRESQGNIWIYMDERKPGARAEAEPVLDIPEVPDFAGASYRLVETMRFPCYVDHAVIGLMDPAHGPWVHQSWLWRSRRSIHEKAKPFGPEAFGFAMRRHVPSKNSFAYKLLGGRPETEIRFRLPGVRIEHVRTGRHVLANLTAVTPISETETEINHCMYWTMPWLSLAKPVVRQLARIFLGQDRRVVVQQQDGLKYDPSLMLIRDADTQARWYFQLKHEWAEAKAEQRPFVNPVKDCVLRWRS
ncbi:MAG: Rieske 2Fe-2S domain-containing protein [Candidatus Hydrogenedens sp.]|nr:Rieske 2Fe-2S domain-containing protein [Candidatus Hydrogenedens sp.]